MPEISFRMRPAFVAAVLLACLCAAAPSFSAGLIGVPKAQSPVKVDGVLDSREWSFAVRTPDLLYTGEYLSPDAGTDIRLQYDSGKLYAAFRIARPKGFEKPRVVPAGETQMFAEDKVRLVLLQNGNKSVLTMNLEKAVCEGFKRDYSYASRANGAFWEGEVAVAVDLDSGAALDVLNIQQTPSSVTSSLSGAENAAAGEMYALKYRGNNAVVSIPTATARQGDRKSFWYEIINNSDAAASVVRSIRVASVEEGADAAAVQAGLAGAKASVAESSVPALQNAVLNSVITKATGRYLVEYAFKDGQGDVASGRIVVNNQVPLKVSVMPYFLTGRFVEVTAQIAEVQKDAQLKTGIYTKDGRELTSASFDVSGKTLATLKLDSKVCAPGNVYQIKTALRTSGGELLSQNSTLLNRPKDPSWFGTKAGKSAFVPKPWTPLRYKNGRISVWGREITLGGGLLPSSLVSSGKEMLAAPVRLRIKVNGKELALTPAAPRVVSLTDEGVELSGGWTAPGLTVQGTMRAEFDGYMWYSFALVPSASGMNIESAVLEIPLKSEHAQIFGTYGEGVMNDRDAPFYEFPPHGKLPDSLDLPFYAFLWMGDGDVGLQYFCESDRYWSLSDAGKPLSLRREGGTYALRVKIVDKAFSTGSSVRYEFGLMGTPVKDMGRRNTWWNPSVFTWSGYKEDGSVPETFRPNESLADFKKRVVDPFVTPASQYVFNAPVAAERKVSIVDVYGWNRYFGAPYTEDPAMDEKIRMMVSATRKSVPDAQVVFYTGWGINKGLSMWDPFGPEMMRQPFETSGWNTVLHCAASDYPDFFVDGVKTMMETYGITGAYLDSTGNVPCCWREGHGCGWRDSEGRLHGTYPIRATRELMKRLYKVTHGETVKNGMIYLHSPLIAPIISFSDLLTTGEPCVVVWKDLKSIDKDSYRALCCTDAFGQPVVICWHYFSPYLKIRTNEITGYALVHGQIIRNSPIGLLEYRNGYQAPSYSPEKFPLRHVINLMEEFSLGGRTEFYPYWKNAGELKVSGGNTLASYYTNKAGDVLVVVCNLEKSDAKVTVGLNIPGRKFTGVTDGMLKTDVPADKDGKVAVDILPQSYRLLLYRQK